VSIAMAGVQLKGTVESEASLRKIEVPKAPTAPEAPVGKPEGSPEMLKFKAEMKEYNEKMEEFQIKKFNADRDIKLSDATLAKANVSGTIGQSLGQLGQGAAGFANSWGQSASKTDDATGQIDAANAQYMQSEADKAKDVQQGMEDMINKIIAFLKDLSDSKANQMASMTKV
jgi:hypothetical protein